ncbi:hypothetical protein ANN_07609 [Periplaneta americana]|uniref:Uncharacterized protein n=1 Tax=Periplaneta americana TaxID=6978 RepID=A0ABQ8T1C0_PERAM|nr:hypothetical protein ANN_07609 [Periplaneta americana]
MAGLCEGGNEPPGPLKANKQTVVLHNEKACVKFLTVISELVDGRKERTSKANVEMSPVVQQEEGESQQPRMHHSAVSYPRITRYLVNAGVACAVAHFGDFDYSVGPVFLLPLLYSNQELVEVHFMYSKADGSAALSRRLYQER